MSAEQKSPAEPPIGAVLAEALGLERATKDDLLVTRVPTPGSDEALALGCTCPVMDNGHGRGRGDGLFWINGDCALHGDDRSHPDRVDGRPQDATPDASPDEAP